MRHMKTAPAGMATNNNNHLVSISIIVALWILSFFSLALNALPLSSYLLTSLFMVFLLAAIVFLPAEIQIEIQHTRVTMFIAILWTCCFLLLLFESSYSVFFIPWNELPPIHFARAVMMIAFVALFPGLGILVNSRAMRSLGLLTFLIVSVIISQLITSCLSFIAFIGSNINAGTILVILVNIVSLALFILWSYGARHRQIHLEFNLVEAAGIAAICFFALLSFYIVGIQGSFIKPSVDQWYHFGWSLRAIENSPLLLTQSYYWPQLFYAQYFMLSGVPYINAYILLGYAPLIQILAFANMTKFLSDIRTSLLSTCIFTVFLGLGGVVFLVLCPGMDLSDAILASGSLSGDLMHNTFSWFFYLLPKSFTIAIIFTLITLLAGTTNKTGLNARTGVFSILLAGGFAWHVGESLFFLILCPIISLLIYRNREQRRMLAIGSSISLILMTALSYYEVFFLSTVLRSDCATSYALTLMPFALVPVLACAAIPLFKSKALGRLGVLFESAFLKFRRFATTYSRHISTGLLLGFIYLLIVWLTVLDAVDFSSSTSVVPLFLFPPKLGIALLLAIVCGIVVSARTASFAQPAILALSIGLLTRAFDIVFIVTGLHLATETRRLEWLWPWLCILTAICFFRAFDKILGLKSRPKMNWRIAATAFLALVLIIGSLGKPLEIYWHATTPKAIDVSDLPSLKALTDLEDEFAVISPGTGYRIVRSLSNKPVIHLWNTPILDATTPLSTYELLSHNRMSDAGFPVGYLYLHSPTLSSDASYSDGYILSHLSRYMETYYSDSSGTIFQVPEMTPESPDPAILLVLSQSDILSGTNSVLCDMLAYSGLSYEIRLPSDVHLSDSVQLVITTDFDLVNSMNMNHWVQQGNRLCYLNTTPDSGEEWVLASSIKSTLGEILTPSIPLSSTSTGMMIGEVISWYSNPDSFSRPLSTQIHLGDGSVVFIDFAPILEMLTTSSIREDVIQLFAQTDEILNMAIPNLPLELPTSVPSRAVSDGNIEAYGAIQIKANSICLSSPLELSRIIYTPLNAPSNVSHTLINGTMLLDISLLGSYEVEISTNGMLVGGTSHPFYVDTVLSAESTISITLGESGYSSLQIINESETQYANFSQCILDITLSNQIQQNILLKKPKVNISGSVEFERFLVDKFELYSDFANSEAAGSIQFRILSSGNLCILSELFVDGVFKAHRYNREEAFDSEIEAFVKAASNPSMALALGPILGIFLIASLIRRVNFRKGKIYAFSRNPLFSLGILIIFLSLSLPVAVATGTLEERRSIPVTEFTEAIYSFSRNTTLFSSGQLQEFCFSGGETELFIGNLTFPSIDSSDAKFVFVVLKWASIWTQDINQLEVTWTYYGEGSISAVKIRYSLKDQYLLHLQYYGILDEFAEISDTSSLEYSDEAWAQTEEWKFCILSFEFLDYLSLPQSCDSFNLSVFRHSLRLIVPISSVLLLQICAIASVGFASSICGFETKLHSPSFIAQTNRLKPKLMQ